MNKKYEQIKQEQVSKQVMINRYEERAKNLEELCRVCQDEIDFYKRLTIGFALGCLILFTFMIIG